MGGFRGDKVSRDVPGIEQNSESLLEALHWLKGQPASTTTLGDPLHYRPDLWQGHQEAVDAAIALLTRRLRQLTQMQPKTMDGKSWVPIRDVMNLLGWPKDEEPL
jgi:hypothetical protein